MRVIFVNPPRISKYLIILISLFYKEKFFLNHQYLKLNEFFIKKNIKPVDFSNLRTNKIKHYIFGNSLLYNHTKSFFFKNFENIFKKHFFRNIDRKSLTLSLHEKIIPLSNYTLRLSIWLQSQKKINTTVFYFESRFFYAPQINSNTKKFVIPLDFLKIDFMNIIRKFNFKFNKSKKNKKKKIKRDENTNKTLLYIVNQSLQYGSDIYKLYEKDLILEKKSSLKKYTDTFVFGKDLTQISLRKLLRNLYSSIKFLLLIIPHVRNFKNILLILYFSRLFLRTKNFLDFISQKKYYCCYVDYDILLPSYIYFALKILNIKVYSYQERFNLGFKTHRISVFTDHYFTNNNYQIKNFKKSNYITAKTFQPSGQIRSELIKSYKSKTKKIITIFGYITSNNKIRSMHEPLTSFHSQKIFLNDCISLSKIFKNYKIILRFKSLEWLKNDYFNTTLKKINKLKNIEISHNYKPNESYKLCAESKLIICRWTSIIDEALSAGKKVLVYDYSAESSPITKEYFNYGNKIICKNFEELITNTNLILNRNISFNKFISKKNIDKYYKIKRKPYTSTKYIIRNELEKEILKIRSNEKKNESKKFK